MPRACRFTQPYSREIYLDGKPFIYLHRAVDKNSNGPRPTDVDTVSKEIIKLLCGTRRKSSFAGSRRRGLRDGAPAPATPAAPAAAKPPAVAAVAGWWPFSKKKPAPRSKMTRTVMLVPDPRGAAKYGYRQLQGSKRKRRRR